MFKFPLHRISTCVVIQDDEGKVLLVHLNYGDRSWSLPSGILDHNEGVDAGAVREVREETGLQVEITGVVGLYHVLAKHQLVVAFRAAVTGGELVRKTNETTDAMYWSADLLPERLRGVHKRVIEDAVKQKKRAKVRII